MYFEQFYLGCLSHASYLLGSEGEAAVVDPQRDIEIYVKAAAEHGLKIRHIFETHLHADFVSGHQELAAITGAKIYVGAQAGATYTHVDLHDGFEVRVGAISIRALETPGHTPEGISLVITDHAVAGNGTAAKPWAVLTGDTLFIGDVGRPDLAKTHTPAQLAGLLYDSLHNKLMKLPDETLVYPAHGAGSLCGRNMRAERSSTIGTERLTNYALQIPNRDEFVRQLTENLPVRPEYFSQDAEINRTGATSLASLPDLMPISPADLKSRIEKGELALDVRTTEQFSAGHIPGSINIALSGQFASWAGSIIGLSSHPILIADNMDQVAEARLRLARVGIENPAGFLEDGIEGWKRNGYDLEKLPEISVGDLKQRLENFRVLDVRREPEWQGGHIADAAWWPLDNFRVSPPEVDRSIPLAVHCKGGYRSVIACSLLRRAGFENIINMIGGFDAWQLAGLPVERDIPVGKK
jgi:hydroxyacylglutathione hydrolase